MAKKKDPAETTEVVDIQDPINEGVLATDVSESEAVGGDLAAESIELLEDSGEILAVEIPEEPTGSGVGALILGGVLAAIIGFVAARSNVIDNFLPPTWRMNAGEIALQEQITSTQSEIDALSKTLAAISSDLSTSQSPTVELDAQIAGLINRVRQLEDRPVASDAGNTEFSGDFAQLRQAAEKQQAEIDALLADARLVDQTSQDAASKTLARAAASRIAVAIETGAPFAGALGDLEAVGVSDIPSELRAVAADGVVTLASLQRAIPDVARAALAASPVDEIGGLGNFLKRQLGARSVAPREGSDPDAILSRIEGAVREGHLANALSEAETLPDDAKTAMSDWLEDATTRLAVTTASETLMQRIAAN